MDSIVDIFSQNQDRFFINPKMEMEIQTRLKKQVSSFFRGRHIWLLSSGTESQRGDRLKAVALSQEALLHSAKGVCEAFAISQQDIIYRTLPRFHISGLAQEVRSLVSGASLFAAPELQWSAEEFCHQIEAQKVTITSLVPTQIYDLVNQGYPCPTSLRWVFVGGGSLQEDLIHRAQSLRWPLALTYGMTETCAMIAHYDFAERLWRPLPHLADWQTDERSCLRLKSMSLLSGYALMTKDASEFVDPKVQGWFQTDDRVDLQGKGFSILGRETELIKIKGETVSLLEMNLLWARHCLLGQYPNTSVIVAWPSARDGHSLLLVSETVFPQESLDQFNLSVLPYQRVHQQICQNIPRTDIGKVRLGALLEQLRDNAELAKKSRSP